MDSLLGTYFPASHATHAACPAAPWLVPTPHAVQLVERFTAAKLPAAHALQLESPGASV